MQKVHACHLPTTAAQIVDDLLAGLEAAEDFHLLQ